MHSDQTHVNKCYRKANKKGQSRDTDNIGYTSDRQTKQNKQKTQHRKLKNWVQKSVYKTVFGAQTKYQSIILFLLEFINNS